MPTIEVSIVIAAPPMSVSDVLLDIEAAPLWTSGLERLELVEGVLGHPGSVARAHYVDGRSRSTLEDRLVEATPGRHFKSEIRGDGLRATVETELEEIPVGTRLTVRWSGTGTNPLTRLALPFLKTRVRRRSQEDLRALKSLVEAKERSVQRP